MRVWKGFLVSVVFNTLIFANPFTITTIDISKLPKLAWPVPAWYFDEVKEWFWEDIAKKYEEFASYFTDYVKENKQEKIAESILAVFNNPWEKRVFSIFLKKLKRYSNWKEVSQEKISELKELTNKMWIVLNQDIKNLNLARISKEEQIKKIESNIANKEKILNELRKEKNELRKKENELRKKENELRKKENELIKEKNELIKENNILRKKEIELDKKIQILEKTIKQRKQDIDKLKVKNNKFTR